MGPGTGSFIEAWARPGGIKERDFLRELNIIWHYWSRELGEKWKMGPETW